MKAWTKEEDQYLREHYVADGAKACTVALDRNFASVTHRARRLGLATRVRPWTSREDDQLRMAWGIHPIDAVARRLGRSVESIYWRARVLGIGLGCPQGHEYLSLAARRTGFDVVTLRRILNWARVRIDRASTRHGRPHLTKNRRTWVVEPASVDEAVAKWLATESVAAGAERRGIAFSVLLRLLKDAIARGDQRVPPKPAFKKQWRVPSALLDELVGRRATFASLRKVGARFGVSGETLANWLKASGVPYSRNGVVIEEAERVIEERRSALALRRGNCRAWMPKRSAA